MKILVIYYRDDYDAIKEQIRTWEKQGCKAKFIMHQVSEKRWHMHVRQDIRDCNCVVMFAGVKTWNSPKVAWEIRVAKKYKKTIYVVRIEENVPIHEQLFRRLPVCCKKSDRKRINQLFDRQKNRSYPYERKIEKFFEELLKYERHDFGVFSNTNESHNSLSKDEMEILFGQYELFVKTSEDLVQRRQTANSFYISINAALLAFCGTLFETAKDANSGVDVASRLWLLFTLCLIGILISRSWRKMLISYGQLNKGKLRVIAEIEKRLPASIFDSEWNAVKNPMHGYEHKSYTEREKDIPLIFLTAYGAALVIILGYAGYLLWKYLIVDPDTVTSGGYSILQLISSMVLR